MPGQTDNADHPSTLPLPELNPLQNPILGQHMGRWAEVYFTSPPEKREQAVLELLRELEASAESSERALDSQTSVSEHDSIPVSFPSFRTAETHLMTAFCPSCGHKNRAEQKFCGMCGIHLQSGAVESSLGIENLPHVEARDADPDLTVEHRDSLFAPTAAEPKVPEHEIEPVQPDHEVRWNNNAFGGIHDLSPPKSSYRVYAGMTLAILLVVLFFVGWRSTRGSSGASVQSSPKTTSKPTAPASIQTAKQDSQSSVGSLNTAGEASDTQVLRFAPNQAHTATRAPVPPAQKPQDKAPIGGSEELAIAQTYLKGTEGKERNSEEAAKWLWKAVAKQNTDATLELSDLYLRGDGVTKNCDQARVLLDAAALKGIKSAGERLRNLQSFGCE